MQVKFLLNSLLVYLGNKVCLLDRSPSILLRTGMGSERDRETKGI